MAQAKRLVMMPLLFLVLSTELSLQAQTTTFNGVEVPGVVIQHSPASSGIYLASPSIAILPNGDYIASHDETGPNSTNSTGGVTQLYRSSDKGNTWASLSTLEGQFWSNLFVLNDDLYILGTDRGSMGDLVIRRSTDNGATWTTPHNAATGRLLEANDSYGYHTAPVPVVVHGGRVWRAFEDTGNDGGWANHFRAGMMSAPVGSNLLSASNWTFTNTLVRDKDWLPGVPGPGQGFNGWLEGNAVVDPEGQIVNVLRIDVDAGMPEKAAIARPTSTSQIAFDPEDDIVDMPGASKKFTIRYHPATNRYWTLANAVTDENYLPNKTPSQIRNVVAVMSSSDLRTWQTERTIIRDLSDVENIGFSYLDWQFEGSDIVAVARTAHPDGLGGATRFHDANFLTFHRVAHILQPFSWNSTESGNWLSAGNWTSLGDGAPNSNNLSATFGDVIGSANRTVYVDETVTVNSIELDTTLGGSYVIAGYPAITLAVSDDLVSPTIFSSSGSHQFQVPLNLTGDTYVEVLEGDLAFNNQIDLNGNHLVLSGNVHINHSIVGGGSVAMASGALLSDGPASIAGDLHVSDTLVMSLGSSDGTTQLNVLGKAVLSGTLLVQDTPGELSEGTYPLLHAARGLDVSGLELHPDTPDRYSLIAEEKSLMLRVHSVPEPATSIGIVLASAAKLLSRGRRVGR